MFNFEIIGTPGVYNNQDILQASAERGGVEYRVATPWGAKLAKVHNYQLVDETTPDDNGFRFVGTLGRFGVRGYADSATRTGAMGVDVSEEDKPELLTLLNDDAPLTAGEWFEGYS